MSSRSWSTTRPQGDQFARSPSTGLSPGRSAFVVESLEPRRMMTVTAGFSEMTFGDTVSRPVAMDFSPDGRLFVAEQDGQLRVITRDGTLLDQPFVTLPVQNEVERGLLGLTFDPEFATNRFVYVYWTTTSGSIHNVVSRLTASADDPNVAQAGSRVDLLHLPTLGPAYHNGGAMHFGPDGKLYVGVGDNTVPDDAQSLNSVMGKMLRINRDGSIPADNPFYARTTGNNRAIWATGLRNPFTFAFDPANGTMHINDVGQDVYEEVNVGAAGANYGWPRTEGPTDDPAHEGPLYSYAHGENDVNGCGITGAAFYRAPAGATDAFPSWANGDYFFADQCGGWIKRRDATGSVSTFASNIRFPVDLKVGPDGSLYYLSIGDNGVGKVGKISYTDDERPSILEQPASQSAAVGEPVTFSVAASGALPLTYQWRRNGQDIPGANAPSHTIPSLTAGENGARYSVLVTSGRAASASAAALLTVGTNRAPAPAIESPALDARFAYGDTIAYAGSATDPEDGVLPDSAFTWRVDLFSGGVQRPFLPAVAGARQGSFVLPTETPFSGTDVSYRVFLTTTDSGGRSTTVTRDILPRTAQITLKANVPGLTVALDGRPEATPKSLSSVAGFKRLLSAEASQVLDGVTYDFANWSDGGAPSHSISSPAQDTTYTAVYLPRTTVRPGLNATYFDDADLSGASVSRTDPRIKFAWNNGSPSPGIGPDTFSARWTGKINVPRTGAYTFYSRASDGFRLWVNGALVIDRWARPFAGPTNGRIALRGGQKYAITVEYFELDSDAHATLSWRGPGIAKQVVPASRFTTG